MVTDGCASSIVTGTLCKWFLAHRSNTDEVSRRNHFSEPEFAVDIRNLTLYHRRIGGFQQFDGSAWNDFIAGIPYGS
jgi:hypothetical protein